MGTGEVNSLNKEVRSLRLVTIDLSSRSGLVGGPSVCGSCVCSAKPPKQPGTKKNGEWTFRNIIQFQNAKNCFRNWASPSAWRIPALNPSVLADGYGACSSGWKDCSKHTLLLPKKPKGFWVVFSLFHVCNAVNMSNIWILFQTCENYPRTNGFASQVVLIVGQASSTVPRRATGIYAKALETRLQWTSHVLISPTMNN